MRRRPPSPDHAAAVSRRLATLSAELAAVREGDPAAAAPGRADARMVPPAARPGVVAPPAPAHPPTAVPGVEPDLDGHTHVRAEPPPEPVLVPLPGRHAHRRGARLLLPGSAHLAVVAVLVAVGLGVTTWLLVGGAAEPVDPAPVRAVAPGGAEVEGDDPGPGEEVSPTGADEAGENSGASPAGVAEVTVDVAGKVRRPGIAVLPVGSRVVDALEAAGGARRGVDLSGLNLARVLVDGEQVLVGAPAPQGSAAHAGAGPAGGTALVNLNTADQTTLETLPGVGPVTAQAILAWRTEHGAFTSVDELVEVDGIGEATLADLAPLVTV